MAAGRAFIGRFPSLPSPPYLPSPTRLSASQLASQERQVVTNARKKLQLLVSNNLHYDVIPSSKGITTNLYGGTNNMAAFGLRWMFNDYYFMVLLLGHFTDGGSMSSSRKLIHITTIPISTASITQKNTFHTPAFDWISYYLHQGSNK